MYTRFVTNKNNDFPRGRAMTIIIIMNVFDPRTTRLDGSCYSTHVFSDSPSGVHFAVLYTMGCFRDSAVPEIARKRIIIFSLPRT